MTTTDAIAGQQAREHRAAIRRNRTAARTTAVLLAAVILASGYIDGRTAPAHEAEAITRATTPTTNARSVITDELPPETAPSCAAAMQRPTDAMCQAYEEYVTDAGYIPTEAGYYTRAPRRRRNKPHSRRDQRRARDQERAELTATADERLDRYRMEEAIIAWCPPRTRRPNSEPR